MKSSMAKLTALGAIRRRGKVLLAIGIMVVLVANMIIPHAGLYESKANDTNETENTDAVWMDKLENLNLKGDGSGEDALTVAVSQLSYEAVASQNADGNIGYYSLYGAVCNKPYGAWNTAFTAFCLDKAKVDTEVFPISLDCKVWIDMLRTNALFIEASDGTPVPGDLAFFDRDGNSETEYVGIVEDVVANEDGTQTLHIIVGDYDGKVQEVEYVSTAIIGYGVTPHQPAPVTVEDDVAPAAPATANVMAAANAPRLGATQYKETVDSRADGITLNLFDYEGWSQDGLDKWDNRIDHPYYEGINVDTTRSNARRDLLFLGQGQHDKNDYPNMMNRYTDGAKARQGIVNVKLVNGYPTLSTNNTSLDYLFDPDKSVTGKTTYTGVNHLFSINQEGYYEYNSNNNYAQFDTNTSNFLVYPGTYQDEEGKPIGFFPFNQYNSNQRTVKPEKGNCYYHHHFGLTMDINFLLAKNKQYKNKDMVFEFSGDDDVWVFVDDVLLLDIGGIHDRVSGSINFKERKVTVNGAVDLNGNERGTVTKTFEEIFKAADKTYDNTDWSQHSLKFFYLERGGCYSNNWIKFNLPTGLQISKELSGDDQNLYDKKDFYFKLFVKDPYNDNYDVYRGNDAFYGDNSTSKVSFDSKGIFKMKAGETVNILDIDANRSYFVQEVDIDGNLIEGVDINSKNAEPTYTDQDKKIYTVSSSKKTILSRMAVHFNNKLKKEYGTLKVVKKWLNADGEEKIENLPDSITAEVYQECSDAKNNVTEKKLQDITLTGGNQWKVELKDLLTVYGDLKYTYKVKEIAVPGYTTTYETVTDPETGNITVTITNTENPFAIKVIKKWFKPDGSEKKENLPGEIKVALMRTTTIPTEGTSGPPEDSEPVETITIKKPKQGGEWSYTWTDKDLDAYDKDGNLYYYYVEEESGLTEYTTSYDHNIGITGISGDDNVITINNTCRYVENLSMPSAGSLGFAAFTLTGMFSLVLLCLIYIVSKMQKGGVTQ